MALPIVSSDSELLERRQNRFNSVNIFDESQIVSTQVQTSQMIQSREHMKVDCLEIVVGKVKCNQMLIICEDAEWDNLIYI